MTDYESRSAEEGREYRAVRTRDLSKAGFGFAILAVVAAVVGSTLDTLSDVLLPNYSVALVKMASNTVVAIGASGILYTLLQFFLEFGGSVQIGGLRLHLPREDSQREISGEAPTQVQLYSPMASATVARLKEEVRAQTRRANTNLIMGLLAAIISLSFLGWLSSQAALDMSKPIPLTSDGVTRTPTMTPMLYWGAFSSKIALSVAANVFAFFFLSTYRRNLTEVRYYQNELTNLENSFLALFFSSEKGYIEISKKILLSLSSTERNFLLKRGESTVDLGTKALDRDEIQNLLAHLVDASPDSSPHKPRRKATPAS